MGLCDTRFNAYIINFLNCFVAEIFIYGMQRMFDDQKSEISKSFLESTTPHRRAKEGQFIGPEVISKHSVVLVNSYFLLLP